MSERDMNIVLKTPRLQLRQFAPDDASRLFDLNSDPEVIRFLGPAPSLETLRDEIIPFHLAVYQQFDRLGTWAAEERATSEFLGWFHFRAGPGQDARNIDLGYRVGVHRQLFRGRPRTGRAGGMFRLDARGCGQHYDDRAATVRAVLAAQGVAHGFGEVAGQPESEHVWLAALSLWRSVVGDPDLGVAVVARGGECGRLAGGTAVQCLGYEAGKDPGELAGVGDEVGQVFRQAERDGRAAWPQVLQGRREYLVEADRPEVGLQRSGLEPSQVPQVGEEQADPRDRAAGVGGTGGPLAWRDGGCGVGQGG